MKLVQRLALRYYRTKFSLIAAVSKKKAAEKAFALFCTPQVRNKKALPKIFEQGEVLRLKLDGIQVQGWRWVPKENGLPASGKKAMICHGFESSVINFDRYIKPLLKKDTKCWLLMHRHMDEAVANRSMHRSIKK